MEAQAQVKGDRFGGTEGRKNEERTERYLYTWHSVRGRCGGHHGGAMRPSSAGRPPGTTTGVHGSGVRPDCVKAAYAAGNVPAAQACMDAWDNRPPPCTYHVWNSCKPCDQIEGFGTLHGPVESCDPNVHTENGVVKSGSERDDPLQGKEPGF